MSGRSIAALTGVALLALLLAVWAVSRSPGPDSEVDERIAAPSIASPPPPASGSEGSASRTRPLTPLPRRHRSVAPPPRGSDEPNRTEEPASTECEPNVARACRSGDVYSIDGCGEPGEKLDECGDAMCRKGRCDVSDPAACGDETAFGRCDGDVVRACHAGRVGSVDCATTGRRCIMTEDGAACRKPPDQACEDPSPRCVDEGRLERCSEHGARSVIDCAAAGGYCEAIQGGARCVVERASRIGPAAGVGGSGAGGAAVGDPCGACGCRDAELGLPGDEVCDGYDNNGDGRADEGADCGDIDVLAFVVVSESGATSYTEEDVVAELARVRTIFEELNPHTGLRFRLAGVQWVARNEWRAADTPDVHAMIADPALHPPRPRLYVPVVFTDVVHDGSVPRYGSGTLPPGACNGLRPAAMSQARGGLVIVSKARHSTTLAHELGHFFGLCHTHQHGPAAVVERLRHGQGGEQATECTGCRQSGDGVCDTPDDPGPGSCRLDTASCGALCADGAQPDASNLMSYYHDCRWALSTEQGVLLRRGLALRRAAWLTPRELSLPTEGGP